MKGIKRELEEIRQQRSALDRKAIILDTELRSKRHINKARAQEEAAKTARLELDHNSDKEIMFITSTGYSMNSCNVMDKFGNFVIDTDCNGNFQMCIEYSYGKDPARILQELGRIYETFEFAQKNSAMLKKVEDYYRRLCDDEEYLNLRLSIWLLLAK